MVQCKLSLGSPESSKGDSKGPEAGAQPLQAAGTLRVTLRVTAPASIFKASRAAPSHLSPLTLPAGWEGEDLWSWRSQLLGGLEKGRSGGTVLSHGARALVLHLVSPKAPTV